MKKICIFLFSCVIFTNAQVVNAVAIIVNNEPITLFEIQNAMNELKIDRTEAVKLLINDRIEQAQIKKMGNIVDEFELESEIKKMLTANESDLQSFKNELKAQGKDYESFKKEYRKQLEKRKLYEAVASGAKIDYSDEGVRKFYETHEEDFLLFEQILVSVFSSKRVENLEKFRQTGIKTKDIKERQDNLNVQNTDPRLLVFLSGIEIDAFSPVLENESEFVLYKVKRKNSPQALPFEQIKEQVSSVYVNKQRQDYIKDFFDKAHSKAQIVRLR